MSNINDERNNLSESVCYPLPLSETRDEILTCHDGSKILISAKNRIGWGDAYDYTCKSAISRSMVENTKHTPEEDRLTEDLFNICLLPIQGLRCSTRAREIRAAYNLNKGANELNLLFSYYAIVDAFAQYILGDAALSPPCSIATVRAHRRLVRTLLKLSNQQINELTALVSGLKPFKNKLFVNISFFVADFFA